MHSLSLFCKTIPYINLPSSGQIKASKSEKESFSSVGIILTINGRKVPGNDRRRRRLWPNLPDLPKAGCWRWFWAPGPLDPSRFEPLIELLQQTRDFARLNFDLAKCLSFYQFSPKNIAMEVFLVLAKKCVHDKVVVEAGRRLVGPGASLVPPGGQDDQSWFVW